MVSPHPITVSWLFAGGITESQFSVIEAWLADGLSRLLKYEQKTRKCEAKLTITIF